MTQANHATVGCAFASDDALVAAVRELTERGAVSGWRIGALDAERAQRLGASSGATADVDPLDPLRGVAGLVADADAAARVNRGALFGSAAGALAGALAGVATRAADVIPASQGRPVALTLLCFVVGVAAGGVLGGAIGKRSSTHAGFRLIDAMEAGHAAALGRLDPAREDEVRELLEARGASEILVIAA